MKPLVSPRVAAATPSEKSDTLSKVGCTAQLPSRPMKPHFPLPAAFFPLPFAFASA